MRAGGFDASVRDWIERGRPFLGICLGMQVLFEASDEDDAPGLGIFEGRVERLPDNVSVPHIGWNQVEASDAGLVDGGYFYFDHSFAVFPADPTIVSGWCEHGRRFAAAIENGSLLGVQFHPEKSGEVGIELLRRWVERVVLEGVSTMERTR
jgi:imidazole glycerol-phosphate synthase subunit HisH